MKRSAVVGNNADGQRRRPINGSGGGMVITSSRVSGERGRGGQGGGIDTLTDETSPHHPVEDREQRGRRMSAAVSRRAAAALVHQAVDLRRQPAGGSGGGIAKDERGTITADRRPRSTAIASSSAVRAAAIHVAVSALTVVNSTIAGNQAEANGGGIYAADGADVNLNAVTIARNVANADAPAGPGPRRRRHLPDRLHVRAAEHDRRPERRRASAASRQRLRGRHLLVARQQPALDRQRGRMRGLHPADRHRGSGPKTRPAEAERRAHEDGRAEGGSPAIGKADNGTAPGRDQRGRKRDNQPDIGAFERGA